MGEYIDVQDSEDQIFLRLHRNVNLGPCGPQEGGGSPLGTLGIYLIHEHDALAALQSGMLQCEDTMVFFGVYVWGKNTRGGGDEGTD